MKVKQLIAELLKHDQEAEVMVDAYEIGVNEVRKVVPIIAYKNANRPAWFGRYSETTPDPEYTPEGTQPINAVYLPRIDDCDSVEE